MDRDHCGRFLPWTLVSPADAGGRPERTSAAPHAPKERLPPDLRRRKGGEMRDPPAEEQQGTTRSAHSEYPDRSPRRAENAAPTWLSHERARTWSSRSRIPGTHMLGSPSWLTSETVL